MPLAHVLLLSALPLQAAANQESADQPSDEELRASVTVSAKEFVERCEFHAESAGDKPLELFPDPVLRWSNPTVGKVFGDVFVWTDHGRPSVVACWYYFFSPNWGATLEVCSLKDGGVSGRRQDVQFWKTNEKGLTMKLLPEADAPAKTPSARLIQMRRIAADFGAQLDDKRRNDTGVNRGLRLLSRPVFRYPAAVAGSNYLDGALFAFAEATDPEAFLLLEAGETSDGATWKYGLARMNRDALKMTYRNQVVWSVERVDNLGNRSDKAYAAFSLEDELKEATVRKSERKP